MTGVTGLRDDGSSNVTIADISAAYDTLLWYPDPHHASWNGQHELHNVIRS